MLAKFSPSSSTGFIKVGANTTAKLCGFILFLSLCFATLKRKRMIIGNIKNYLLLQYMMVYNIFIVSSTVHHDAYYSDVLQIEMLNKEL